MVCYFSHPGVQKSLDSAGSSNGLGVNSISSHSTPVSSSPHPAESSSHARTPNQPRDFHFPAVIINGKRRQFQSTWFDTWTWLEWSQEKERAVCHPCTMIQYLGQMKFSKNADPAFTETGFMNWKKASQKFSEHEQSRAHKEAVVKWQAHVKTTDVSVMINNERQREQMENRSMLMKVIECLKWLGRQGLAIRGHSEDSGNLVELLKLRCLDSPALAAWLRKKTKWLSHDIQNEILEIFARHIVSQISADIRGCRWFSLIVDETTDISRKEQVSICLRYVDSAFTVHESFVGFFETESTTAEHLLHVIEDVLLRLQLAIENCRGQCYDGASNMSGCFTGVQARILSQNPKALYVHCCSHSLNLALQDSSRAVAVIRDTLYYVQQLNDVIRASAKRFAMFENIRKSFQCENDGNAKGSTSLRSLCPTRWSVRTSSMSAVVSNYKAIVTCLEHISVNDRSETGSKAAGLLTTVRKFHFLFGLLLGISVFGPAEQLSLLLQNPSISSTAAQTAAGTLSSKFHSMRSDDSFNDFWNNTLQKGKSLEAAEPVLPRLQRKPKRVDDGAEGVVFATPKDWYRSVYFQFLDCIIAAVSSRFNQPCFSLYTTTESLIVDSANGLQLNEKNFDVVIQHNTDDIAGLRLRTQLAMLHEVFREKNQVKNMEDVVEGLLQLGDARHLYSEVNKLPQLLLTVPASRATAERSFSTLRHLKNFVRSTMRAERLNNLTVLHYIRTDWMRWTTTQ